MKYCFNGKEKRLAFGVYPSVSLARARALRDEAKKKLAEGIDSSFAKKEEKLVRDVQLNNTLQAVALEWYGTKVSQWVEGYGGLHIMGLEFTAREAIMWIAPRVLLALLVIVMRIRQAKHAKFLNCFAQITIRN